MVVFHGHGGALNPSREFLVNVEHGREGLWVLALDQGAAQALGRPRQGRWIKSRQAQRQPQAVCAALGEGLSLGDQSVLVHPHEPDAVHRRLRAGGLEGGDGPRSAWHAPQRGQ